MPEVRLLLKVAVSAIASRSTRVFYDHISPYYNQVFQHHVLHAARMVEVLSDKAAGGSLVLDLACGTGAVACRLTQRDFRVVGLDLSLQSLRHLHEDDRELPILQADADALPFKQATFDAVTCLGAWRHFRKPDIIVQEINRVLRPGGIFFLGYFPARLAGLWAVPPGILGRILVYLYTTLVRIFHYVDRVGDGYELQSLQKEFRNVRRIDSADGEYLILAQSAAMTPMA